MGEEAYQMVYAMAKVNLEKAGKADLMDILRPIRPGVVAGRVSFERFGLRMRMFGALEADTGFDFLGKKLASPIMVAPMGVATLRKHHPDPVRALAAGAKGFGTQCWVGDCEDAAWEEVASLAPSAVRVVKPWREDAKVLRSLKLAEDTGAFAVGVDFESAFQTEGCAPKSAKTLASYVKATGLPFVAKGVGSLDMARAARDAGAAALVVGSHGGSLGPAWGHALEVLPEVARAVGDDLLLLAEGGLRRGEDALKLLARGARGLLAGRAVLLGLFADGADGVAEVLRALNEELREHMVLAGCPDLAAIAHEVLIPR